MKTAVVHVRIEPKPKQKTEGVLRKLGLTLTEAIRIFYRQISLRGGLPFPIEIPKELTASTLEKSRRGKEIQEFESLEGMFKDWGEMKKVSQTRQFPGMPGHNRWEYERERPYSSPSSSSTGGQTPF